MYLSNLVSIENLFFLFEVVLIKNQLLQNKLVNIEDIGVTIDIEQSLIQTYRSQINDIADLKKSLKYIMNQYIEYGSEFCINISAATRSRIQSDFYQCLQSPVPTPSDTSLHVTSLSSNQTAAAQSPSGSSCFGGYLCSESQTSKTPIQYISIFDQAMKEIISLIQNDSLPRFARTAAYKKLAKDIHS